MRCRTAALLLSATLVLAGCSRRDEDTTIYDPPEAFYPHTTLRLEQTRSWGGFEIELVTVTASVREDIHDLRLVVEMEYTNLGSEDASPPDEVRFERDGEVYPATLSDEIQIPGKGYVDGPIPGAATAEGLIFGTLVDVVHTERPSHAEMQTILSNVRLVYGAPGTDQAVFPFVD